MAASAKVLGKVDPSYPLASSPGINAIQTLISHTQFTQLLSNEWHKRTISSIHTSPQQSYDLDYTPNQTPNHHI